MATISKELQELLAEVSALKDMYAAARTANSSNRRGKYPAAVQLLKDSPLPLITLDNDVFTSESESGMKQQFKKAQEKTDTDYTLVFVGESKLLVDFDDESAAAAFDAYICERAGITQAQLAEITADLDKATR